MALRNYECGLDSAQLEIMKIPRQSRVRIHQQGFTLIELMISMVVLLIGLGGLLVLLVTALYTNKTASTDTSSTMIAEHVLEQITAQGLQATTPLQITDCTYPTPVTTNFATNPALLGSGNSGATGGNGATLTANGIIDWTQAFASVPTDPVSGYKYALTYTGCGTGGKQTVYDVRWNVITMSSNDRLIVIGARPANATINGGLRFVVPANLRTID
jgi:prepilin-type N-terminal cleavage/methylation domain-containing protein